jgi:aspartyl/asparaginyl beta-hydroxylase (cupin superfamily)
MPRIDVHALAASALDALHRGDVGKARESFQQVVDHGRPDAGSLLALADACRRLDDVSAAMNAVDKALSLEPRNLRALMLKADLLATLGNDRAASSFYQFAVQAAPPADQLPPDLRRDIERAMQMRISYGQKFEQFLLERLQGTGVAEGPASARFAQSLDIMLGKKNIYFQQPEKYYFPELPQIQFYDRNLFPWMDEVEAATDEIRAELTDLLKDGSGFRPYVESDPRRPRKEQSGLTDNPDWSAFYLWKSGRAVPENIARCPRTIAALARVPFPNVANRSPEVHFSLLRPGARIPPHSGLFNTRLICHLPLIVPPGCGFRVGNETRVPVEGRAWVFDDTIEHEAWNLGDRARVILLFEVWRPELTEAERRLVRAMFEAIDAYSGQPPASRI